MGNKAAAKDWHNDQRLIKYRNEEIQKQATLLFYASEKRDNMPDSRTLESVGCLDVADKVRQAMSLLSDANTLMQAHIRNANGV